MHGSLLEAYLSSHSLSTQRKEVIAYLATLECLKEQAPTIAKQIIEELQAQRSSLKLIASENYSSLCVQLAMGNLLTDKYCEGYPHHRFYAGCEHVDAIESETVDLAKKLFGADHAYVQPHSGADANLVAFWAILTQRIQHPALEKWGKKSPDDFSSREWEKVRHLLCNQSFIGMGLSSGGHLTHGFRQNISAKMMRAFPYEVDRKTGRLDYCQIAKLARKVKPLIVLAGYSAYPRRIDFSKMREIADEVGAVLMVDMAHFAGFVAGGAFVGEENPIPYAQVITSTTHKTLRGPRGGFILSQASFADVLNKGCPLVLGGPLPHVIASKAVAFRENSLPSFRTYAQQVLDNAQALAEGLLRRGLSLVTNGTDNHLVLIDLTQLSITGKIAESTLTQAGITVNRNMIPYDPNGAWYTSGVRIGTPALTTLGMGREEMDEVADLIALVLKHTRPQIVGGQLSKAKGKLDAGTLNRVRSRVRDLLDRYPLYPELTITS